MQETTKHTESLESLESERISFYQAEENEYAIRVEKKERQLGRIKFLRIGSFLLAFLLPYQFSSISTVVALGLFVAFLSLFFWSVRKDIRLSFRRDLYKNCREINRKERLSMGGDHSNFAKGEEYIIEDHPYAGDLDLFGEGSLFQLLDRSGSKTGERRLVHWLLNPLKDIEQIKRRQMAVEELSDYVEWRQYYQGVALMHKENDNDFDRIQNWGEQNFYIKKRGMWKRISIILPILTCATCAGFVTGYTAPLFFWSCIILQMISWRIKKNSIETIGNEFGKNTVVLAKYAQLMEIVLEQEFQSKPLKEVKIRFEQDGKSITEIRKLKRAIDKFDQRNMMFFGQILNLFFMHDIRCVIRLSEWHQKNGKKLNGWLDALSEIDALQSLANFTYNNDDFQFPNLVEGDFVFETDALGHPAIHRSVRVNNSLNLSKQGTLEIITGANMAGKSTFLRAVGVNMLLAMIGAPVCAEEMKFSPILLYTHMRTSDNLAKKESYFYAELKHLRSIIDTLEKEQEVFVILDEILRGTNSIDKLNGSREYIKQLIAKGAVGMVATHDLELTKLESQYPDAIVNRCFEVQLDSEELSFDYLLKKGVTQTMNATFLMKKMGIIVDQ